MTWQYDPTELPSAATNGLTNATTEQKKNFIRFITGDINSSRTLTSDEAIFACLATEPNIYYAAGRVILAAVQDLLAGGIEDQKVGETRIRVKRADELVNLVKDLRARGGTHMLPSAGGITLSDRQALEEDTDLLQPSVTKGMLDINTDQRGGRTDVGGEDNNN